jgi:hypothetical protein
MKKLSALLILFLVATNSFSQSFVSPIGFVETDANKAAVIAFIKKQVYDDCTKIGMNDPSTLKVMQEENLKSFKQLTGIANTNLLSKVIKQVCDIGMCSYQTILVMYQQQEKDSKEDLKW